MGSTCRRRPSPGRTGSAGRQPAEHLGRGGAETVRLPGGGERAADLLQLVGPAPAPLAAIRSACWDRVGNPGRLSVHSVSRSSSTPSSRAVARIATSSADVPFVQAAYVIFSADASGTIRASSAEPANRAATPARPAPDR